jgi:hypothetical protein
MLPVLRPYQQEVMRAVMDSATHHRGLTFSVEIARQGGKNELSARLEMYLLHLNSTLPENLVKCSPTFEPQAIISMTRLKDRLDDAGFTGLWSTEFSYIVRMGNARIIFLSAEEEARVVGHTAHLLLEVDEAQDVTREKYSRDFRPMCSTSNATTVLYGTAWDDTTLLEEVKQHNLELERQDGIRRHFRYDWQEVARYNPDYLKYVENERQRLGDDHPLFLTQYCLQPIRGGDGFISASQRAQLQGDHPRRRYPEPGKVYVAGVDLAGEAEELEEEKLISLTPRRDSTVVTIAEVDYSHTKSGDSSFPGSLNAPHPRPDRGSRSFDQDIALDSHLHGNGSAVSGFPSSWEWVRCLPLW